MCGIVGYIGKNQVDLFSVLRSGLLGLEYRGYDSAGIAMINGSNFVVAKCIGGPSNLTLETTPLATVGIGHTRWATHGGISEGNAHPHFDCERRFAVVHNGTIENFAELKKDLIAAGHRFSSETDTEVIAHLIEAEYKETGEYREAIFKAIQKLIGAYGIVVVSKDDPSRIIAARRGSPLLIGIGSDSFMVASDQNALVEYCTRVVYLDDNELVDIRMDGYTVQRTDGVHIQKDEHMLERSEALSGKGSYEHFMLKEIEEQMHTLQAGISGRLNIPEGTSFLGGIRDVLPQLHKATNVILTGCGTAFHAALYGKYLFEQLLNIPIRAEIASELFFEKVNEPPETTVIFYVSQSGETADTKDVLTEMKRRGYLNIGIVNVAGSSIARETDAGVYIRAGVERAVASTKAFTSQILALLLVAVTMARQRGMSKIEAQDILHELEQLPQNVGRLLERLAPQIKDVAQSIKSNHLLTFLGKKYSYPVALEASLKVKEITYIPTDAYPAGELKHGSLALVDSDYWAFVIAPEDNLFSQLSNTVHEIRARGGKVCLITNQGRADDALIASTEAVFFVPKLRFNFLYPFYTVIPFQLLSYQIALALGREIDKPRNLAKSVTVH